MDNNTNTSRLMLFYLLFGVSGLSGLIYESIWTHYIKLFLGHAAYAQSLVLAIFMGGMAIGSWLASRKAPAWRNLLVAYALVEGAIGVAAIAFHNVFVGATDLAQDRLIPLLGSSDAIYALKWGLSAAFILPQSILLGMTFPLMSGGILRLFPQAPGAAIATLYFANSLGAALGVLASGFYLISRMGLPGTMMTAGLLNVALALVVWTLAKNRPAEAAVDVTSVARGASGGDSRWYALVLGASLATGVASFLYEIAWIRMLSLVLGSSTHSFELMLSAFILGLALGGLFIRRRIERLSNPLRSLGVIQIAMGLLAALTLTWYGSAFDWMGAILRALTPTAEGYAAFHLASHAISLAIMLPATVCAGMTLPLLTFLLIQRGHRETAIGDVYAANTVGAIIGVLLAVHVLMPAFGVKLTVVIGVLVDVGLGLVMLWCGASSLSRPVAAIATVICVAVLFTLTTLSEIDPRRTASGVFRSGRVSVPGDHTVVFHGDGKTATVDLLRDRDGAVSILTNGKPDARISPLDRPPAADESTMVLLGALGLLMHPQAKTAASIGMGSGLTTHVLLSTPQLERVDTVEIEPLMVEAAKVGFAERVKNTFADPRSHIHIEDAKTFFSAQRAQYDLIVSEPSNPWVSGVASLFSVEFYDRIRRHLRPNGLFIQWIQAYEIDADLVASILSALSPNFKDYVVYNANDGDLIIVANVDGALPGVRREAFAFPGLATELRRVGMSSPLEVEMRRLGGKAVLDPLIRSFGMPQNSDYFPYLDQNAARVRFMKARAGEFQSLQLGSIPLLEMLERRELRTDGKSVSADPHLQRATRAAAAAAARNAYLKRGDLSAVNETIKGDMQLIALMLDRCDPAMDWEQWLTAFVRVVSDVSPYVEANDFVAMTNHIETHACFRKVSVRIAEWVRLGRAIGARNAEQMAQSAVTLLQSENLQQYPGRHGYLIDAAMLGYLARGQSEQSRAIWETHGRPLYKGKPLPIDTRLLLVHSEPKAIVRSNLEAR